MQNAKGFAHPELIVTAEELGAWLADTARPAPLVLDVRAAEDFANGHVPSAVHLDLWGVSLIDTDPAPLRAFLWIIEHLFQLRGVRHDVPVVVYEDQSGVRAARVFWFLELFGHPDVRVLDGGYPAWRGAGLPVTRDAIAPTASTWTARTVDTRLATWRDVHDRLGSSACVMLDTRTDDEYHARIARAARGGAIPGAIHIEWKKAIDETGAFRSAAQLQAMYEGAGVTRDREVVTYCQGGYRAAHAYLTLRLLGYPRVRNYLGSWKEWGDRTELPIEVPDAARQP